MFLCLSCCPRELRKFLAGRICSWRPSDEDALNGCVCVGVSGGSALQLGMWTGLLEVRSRGDPKIRLSTGVHCSDLDLG